MENNKKNSAVEKVEILSAQTENSGDLSNHGVEVNEPATVQNPVKRTKTTKRTKTVKAKPSTEKQKTDRIKREQLRVEREAKKQERHLELARQRAQRMEERTKRVAERKQEVEKKRAEYLAQKLKEKEKRIARRDMLKNESAEARRERIAEERRENLRLKKEKAQIRAQLISEKRENKRILKQQKRELRARDKQDKRARGIGGWLAAVISLSCAVLILGTLFTFNLVYMSGNNELLNGNYQRAYYDLAGCVDNIEVNLSKLAVSNSPAQQQKILTDIIVESELAESELQALPLEDETKYSTSKYINQLGDFSKTLSYKLASGGTLTEEDRETLNELYRRNGNLQTSLTKISEEMGEKFSFLSLLKPEEDNVIINNFNELENNSLEYPKMIYDGPFSDGLDVKEVRGLSGSEITETQAVEKFKALFASYGLKEVEVNSQAHGDIETYNVEAKTDKDSLIYAQMAKRGGNIVLFNCYEPCEEEKFTVDECREIAEVFVKKAGFENMTPVWQTASRAVCQFNFAFEQDGVIVYSDLVKVNVCMERGLVSAVEASTYYYNHTEREIGKPKITKSEAREKVCPSLSVQSTRLAIVPIGNSKERLAYEVCAECEGETFYVYVDATTGEEIEIFKVINSKEGMLLL